jgi:hypothetical protein
LSEPKVWYKPQKKTENRWDTWSGTRRRQEEETARKAQANTVSQINSLQMKAVQSQARHDVSSRVPQDTPVTQRVQESAGLRFLANATDDEIRDNLGLTPDINVDMFRTNPSLFMGKDENLDERVRNWVAMRQTQQDEESNQDQIWVKDAWGFIKSGLDKAGISTAFSALGTGLEFVENVAMDIPNEKISEWFPDDGSGKRAFLGRVLGQASPVPLLQGTPTEGGQPRLMTFKQIQGVVQDAINELPVGTEEEKARYLATIEELKAEGMSDDDARIQAFNNREDMPEWFKYALPIISDPTTVLGGAGILRGGAKIATRGGRGLRKGLSAKEAARIADEETIASGVLQEIDPRSFDELVDELAAPHTGVRGRMARLNMGERVANIPGVGKVVNKLPSVDPSGKLRNMAKGSVERTLLGAKAVYGRFLDDGAKNSEFIVAQAKGNFGKLEDVWGETVLQPGRKVKVQVRPTKELDVGGFGKVDDIDVPIADVLSNPTAYRLTAQQQKFADWFGEVYENFAAMARKEGLDMNLLGDFKAALYFSARRVTGKYTPEGVLEPLAGYDNYVRRAGQAGFEKSRTYEAMREGVEAGYEYADVYETLGVYANSFYKQVALKRLEKAVEPFTRSTSPREAFGDLYDAQKVAKKLMNQQVSFAKEINRFMITESQFMNSKTINKMKKAFYKNKDDSDYVKGVKNQIQKDIDEVVRVRKNDWNLALKAFEKTSKDIMPEGMTYKALRDAIMKGRPDGPSIYGNVAASELKDALKSLNLRKADNDKIIMALTKEMGKHVRQTRKESLQRLVNNMNEITPGSKAAFQRIKDDVGAKAQTVTRPQVVDGVQEQVSRLFPGDRIYTGTKESVDAMLDLDKHVLDQANSFLRNTQNMNSALRYFKTTFDLGTPLIQGLPVLFRDPEAWGRATGMMLKTLKDPAVRARYVADNAEDINRYLKYGMHIGSTEATQALQQGGWLARLPTYATSRPTEIAAEGVAANTRRLGAQGLRPMAIVAQRAGAAYDVFLDVSRIEMMKGLENLAGRTTTAAGKRTGGISSFTYDKDMAELAQFVNKTTGVVSSRAMGIGVNQQALEGSALLFSPQYTRATAALFMDMTSGGLRGDQARKAVASLFAGQLGLHAAIATATGQEMNLTPGRGDFLKVQLGDTMVGFGSKSNALVNMFADVSKQVTENPEGLMNWKVWDNSTFKENSFLKRLRYQSSPLTGQALSWITGTDAIGRTLPDPGDVLTDPRELGKYVGSQLLPIWMEAAYENGDFKGASGIYEMFGASARDVEHRTTRRELQEKYFKEDDEFAKLRDEGFTFAQFQKHPRYRTMYSAMQGRHPDLVDVEEKLKEVAKDFAWGEERAAYDERISIARTEQIEGKFSSDGTLVTPGFKQIALEFESGVNGARSGQVFREKLQLAAQRYHSAKAEIRKQFPNLVEQNEQYYKGSDEENKVNAVTSEYFDFLQSPLSRDAFGNMNYAALDSFMSVSELKYGEEVMAEVAQLKEQRLLETPDGANLPQIVIDYYQSQTALRPFWETWKEVLSPDQQKEYRSFAAASAGQKELLRAGNPRLVGLEDKVKYAQDAKRAQNYEIDKYLMNYYDYAPKNRRLIAETEQLAMSIRRGTR